MKLLICLGSNLFRRSKIRIYREYSPKQPWHRPTKEGLYDPQFEKEGCGVGMIVSIDGDPSHKIMQFAKKLSLSMAHRGACAYDNKTGDGAGVLTATPQQFFANVLKTELEIQLPPLGKYAAGLVFMDKINYKETEDKFSALAEELQMSVLGWREVRTDGSVIGDLAKHCEPLMKQVFVAPKEDLPEEQHYGRYYILRKRSTLTLPSENRRFYICSLNPFTVVYKGQLTATQLWLYFPELSDPLYRTSLAIVHNRFATNTLPSWELAHPYRILAHNGEINTINGNVNYMKARETMMESDVLGDQLSKIYPVVESNTSDSGCLDNMLEFLMHAGKRSLPEAVMTLIPEAWHNDETMSEEKRTFYKWSACAMEPWDGPAMIAFSDGKYAGAVQDRNGLRPSRFFVTKSNLLVMASEIDMYDIDDPSNIVLKSRLKPGRMLLVDLERKTMIADAELKSKIAQSRPHPTWLKEQLITLEDLKRAHVDAGLKLVEGVSPCDFMDKRLQLFNYFPQAIHMQLVEMFANKKEAMASMGNDDPLACLSHYCPLLYSYFKQGFAQVTNPPVDPIREKIAMSLECPIGPMANLLLPSAKQAHRLWLKQPIISAQDMEILKSTKYGNWSTCVIDTTYNASDGLAGLRVHIDRIRAEAEQASKTYQILVLSDRNAGKRWIPIGSLLTLGAVHHHLIETRTRMNVGIIVETADAKLVHDMCVLLGYGADAICPYLAIELGAALMRAGVLGRDATDEVIFNNYVQAITTGILFVMARAGITTLQSYKNAQIFEAIGLSDEIIDKCFKGTPTRIGGLTMDMLACEMFERHYNTYGYKPDNYVMKDKGIYHYRTGAEKHMNCPESIALLQQAAQLRDVDAYKKFRAIEMESRKDCLIRGQLELKTLEVPIPLGEVESAKDILRRICLGGMNIAALSMECHETLAKAMNSIGSKSNCGDCGEFPERYQNAKTHSSTKQIGAGRWGVTSAYIAFADDIQLKITQGARPGKGGFLGAEKLIPEVAKVMRCPPGIDVVMPPPHHDIYSIEDLSELIYELRCANPKARISVKLAAIAGVGVIASGVVKSKAEHIVISGHDGGSSAATWTSIKHAGVPWELGIAEAHQVLTRNHMRKLVTLQADGQIRTGFDVVVAALLGADEVAMGTVPLISLGCAMTRKCHLNTCPVGIATTNPTLRKKFKGKAEHLRNYLYMLAHDVRFHMASMGIRNFDELIGRSDLLRQVQSEEIKLKVLDLSKLLYKAKSIFPAAEATGWDIGLGDRLDDKLIELSRAVIDGREKTANIELNITNRCRAFASTLSYHISRKYSEAGLPDDCQVHIMVNGSAGQSFCAFLAKGITCTLEGDANDYVGKCLSGGTIIIYPPKEAVFESHLNVIAGNVCLYGATSGKLFLRGIVAERFAVRNSGAIAVVEGVGDHCCEFMTSGTVICLGLTGRNFGSGMLGGVAYVLDIDKSFRSKSRRESVKLLKLEDPKEIESVKNLLHEFRDATGSLVAEEVLKDFNHKLSEFVKVIPRHQYEEKMQVKKEEEKSVKLDRTKGFMIYPRQKHLIRPVAERIKDMKEVQDFQKIYAGAKKEAARCIDCGVPFCQTDYGCPLHNLIPNWTLLATRDRWYDALLHLLQTNNFPEFTGRVCPAPCESGCVLGVSHPSVSIKSVECAIIDKAFQEGWIKARKPLVRTDKRVAVVGSGPAGLCCAAQLNKAGHQVTVYERNEEIGGLLYYGIPSTKLDKEIIRRRVKILQEEEIQFKTKVHVGKDIAPQKLSEEYDAVVLCVGALRPNDITVPGRQLKGIDFALDFLAVCGVGPEINKDYQAILKDKHLVIIGGGPSVLDCTSTAIRHSVAGITTLAVCREPPKERAPENIWPQPAKIRHDLPADESAKFRFGADPRMYNAETIEFVDDGTGHVGGVKIRQVDWVDFRGEWKMRPVKDSEKTIKADRVIVAVGFAGPETLLAEQLSLEYEHGNNFKGTNYKTNVEKIFVAGDCRIGESRVVNAMADGREAARCVDTFLSRRPSSLPGRGGIAQRLTSVDCQRYVKKAE